MEELEAAAIVLEDEAMEQLNWPIAAQAKLQQAKSKREQVTLLRTAQTGASVAYVILPSNLFWLGYVGPLHTSLWWAYNAQSSHCCNSGQFGQRTVT